MKILALLLVLSPLISYAECRCAQDAKRFYAQLPAMEKTMAAQIRKWDYC